MDESRTERQLALIAEVFAIADAAGVECWLRGGWAMDFFLGEVTRPHRDIDLFVWASDAARLVPLLEEHGFAESGGPPPDLQRNFRTAAEEVHMTLLERNAAGAVVSAGGRWADSPWPEGMLAAPPGRIGDLSCRIVSPEAQLWAKEELPRVLGDRQREHDAADVERLRAALGRRS